MRKSQIEQVKEFLLNGWTDLYIMASALGASDAGISARVRDLRKREYGGYNVVKRKLPNRNTWQYRIKERSWTSYPVSSDDADYQGFCDAHNY